MRILVLLAGLVVVSGGAPARARAEYHNHADLSAAVQRIVADYPRSCVSESIGTSLEGRAIWALRLALGGEVDPDRRPAMLLVANLDGDHLVGSAVALEMARQLLARANDDDEAAVAALTEHTLYIVPRVNPDAAEHFFAEVRSNRVRSLRPDDRDRDGAIDEDPPNDLNGDGLITMMRVAKPDEADMMADSGDPRLDARPDRDKGERVEFTLYVEGIDDDGDGEYNEDPVGGVDLNMNFMHGYQQHADGAGLHQVSEPESLALLQYVLGHQNIAVVLTYGRHDNLSKPPDGKGTFPSGAPKNIDAKDVGVYKQISERFVELTGLKKVPPSSGHGAFSAWAYAQFGVPSFTTPLWTRPEAEKEEESKDADRGDAAAGEDAEDAEGAGQEEDEGLTASGIGDISLETMEELRAAAEVQGFEVTDEMVSQLTPQMVEGFARRMGIEVRRVKTPAGGGASRNKEEAAWLTYSDEQRNGEGFVDWQAFDHPQLGPVHIGGWAPYFKTNPPPEAVGDIAAKQVEFVLDLAGRFPEVSLSEPQVTRLAGGLYEVKVALVNDGYLPTGTAMAVQNRRARPYVVRLSAPNEQIITGQRVNKVWSVPGSGGREEFRWIVRAPDDWQITITVYSEKFGEFEKTVALSEAEDGGAS